MSARPTVGIRAGGQGGYTVAVTSGSQHDCRTARALDSVIECADRLAFAKLIQD